MLRARYEYLISHFIQYGRASDTFANSDTFLNNDGPIRCIGVHVYYIVGRESGIDRSSGSHLTALCVKGALDAISDFIGQKCKTTRDHSGV